MTAADKANSKKMKGKAYDKQLRKLQVELCRLQDWVKAEGGGSPSYSKGETRPGRAEPSRRSLSG